MTSTRETRFVEMRPGSVVLRREASRLLPSGWGRVRVAACGVCGTDLHLFRGMDLPRGATYPVRPGLEVADVPAGGALTVIGAGGVGTHILQLARLHDPSVRLSAVVRSEGTARRLEELGLGIATVAAGAGAARRLLEIAGPQDAVVEF